MQNSNFLPKVHFSTIELQNKYIIHEEASYNSLEKFLAFTNFYLLKNEKKQKILSI